MDIFFLLSWKDGGTGESERENARERNANAKTRRNEKTTENTKRRIIIQQKDDEKKKRRKGEPKREWWDSRRRDRWSRRRGPYSGQRHV